MPSEIDMKYKTVELEDHYSFLAATSFTVQEDNLNSYNIYTDQKILELEEIFNLGNVVKVDSVYDYLDKGIIITSWENTDYSKAAVVHVLNSKGVRNPHSRMPFIYYNDGYSSYVNKVAELIQADNLNNL